MKTIPIDVSEAGHRLAVLQGDYLFESGLEPDLKNAERIYVMLWRFQAEIYNGGIWQFFTNSTGAYSPFICDALKTVGADDMAATMREAIINSGPGTPWHMATTNSTLILDAPIAVREFVYKLNDQLSPHLDNLSLLLFSYMLKHRYEFRVSDDFWSEVPLQ